MNEPRRCRPFIPGHGFLGPNEIARWRGQTVRLTQGGPGEIIDEGSTEWEILTITDEEMAEWNAAAERRLAERRAWKRNPPRPWPDPVGDAWDAVAPDPEL